MAKVYLIVLKDGTLMFSDGKVFLPDGTETIMSEFMKDRTIAQVCDLVEETS